MNVAKERILITGATGNVGAATLANLMHHPAKAAFEVVAALRDPAKAMTSLTVQPDAVVELDFTNPATFDSALAHIDRLLLVRPPALTDVDKIFKPFIAAAKRAGIYQVVLLSLQGAEHNPIMPHHKIEKLIIEAGLAFTFLRPSFFMQNLCSTHRNEIRFRNELFVPAGNSQISFIDARDVGAVAAQILVSSGNEHKNRGYVLTGSDPLTYHDIARILSGILNRPIAYRNPSALHFIWRKWRNKLLPLNTALIISALYMATRLGKATEPTNETAQLLGRSPTTFRQFATDHRAAWED